MEHKHGRNEHSRYASKAVAIGMATSALLGISGDAAESRYESSIAHTVETYVPGGAAERQVRIGSEFTIILPPQERAGTVDYKLSLTNEAQLKREGQWCDVPNVPLLKEASPEQIATVAETPMALEYEDYLSLSEELEHTSDRQEVETIVSSAFARAGVKATFNETSHKLIIENTYSKSQSQDKKMSNFVSGMQRQLLALSFVPKDALANDPPHIDFVDGDNIAYMYKDAAGKKHKKYFAGYYDSGDNLIVLSSRSTTATALHELGHKVQNTACAGRLDGELQYGQDEGVKQMHQDPYVKAVYDTLQKDDNGKWSIYDTNYEMRDLTSFPSGYSERGDETSPGSDTGEYFAEAFSETLLNGQIPSGETHQLPMAKVLEQGVVERMKKAMPNVNVPSLIAAQEAYSVMGAGYIPAKFLAKHNVSPLDRTFAGNYLMEGPMISLVPAIRIRTAGSEADNYIYAFESDQYQAPEGKYGGQYKIQLNRSGNDKLDKLLTDTSLKYLQEMAKRKGITLTYIVSESDEDTMLIGSYDKPGVSTEKPDVQYMKITDQGRGAAVGKGGDLGAGG